jgi:hypothetical protein
VNAHNDYVLLHAGQSLNRVNERAPLAYEKPAGLAGGFGLALANGVATFRELRWAHESIAPHTPPLVIGSAFDVDRGAVKIRFNEDASAGLAAGDLIVTHGGTGEAVAASSMAASYEFATHTASFTFPGLDNASLADGDYVATLAPGSVADAAGNLLTAGTSVRFFCLAGDADHDRDVDFADLVALARSYGQGGKSFSQGNFSRDALGMVSFEDLVILARRYGTRLAPPPAVITLRASAKRQPVATVLELA